MNDLGKMKYIFKIKVIQDHKNRKIMLFQATNIDKFLVKYVIQDSEKGLLPFKNGMSFS